MPSFNPFKRSQGTGIGLEISSPVLVSSPEARTRGATAAHQLLNATDELLAKARQQYDSVSCASAPLLPALNDRAPVSPRASSPRAAPSPPSASPTTVPSPSQISADRNHCQAYSTITPARRQRLESCGIAFDPVSPISPRLEFRDDATAVDRMRRFGSNSQKSVNEQSAKAERQFQRAEESHAHHHQPRHRSKSYYPNPETKSRSSLLASQAVINGVDTGKARPKPGALAPESPLRPRFVRRASSLDNLNRAAAHSAPTFLHDGMPAPSPSAVCQSLLVPALTQPAIPSKVNSPGPASPASSRSATPIRFAPYTSSSSVEQSVPACSKKAAAILGLACPVSPTSMTASSTPRSRTTSIRQASARTTVCPAPLIGQLALPPRATEMGVSPTALGMSMKIDGRQQQLDSFEASDRDLVITLRGGKAAVTGLEVMLVCIGEGEETVWELRVKRRNVDLGGSCDLPTPDNPGWPMPQRSGSAAPSSAGSYCNAPFTAIYTPPCEDLNMHRACYFSTPKPILPPRALTGTDAPYVSPARSPTSSRPQTSPTLSPTIRRHGTSGNTQLTALAERRSPAAPTSARSRFASPLPSPSYDENMRPSQSTPVTPRRTRFRLPSETVIGGDRNSIRSLNSNEDAGAGSTFSPAYRGLAQAYRAAYQAANSDGRKANEEAKTAVFASPESADQFPVSPASVFASSSPRSTCSLATRSPEHRYALYMSRSDKSTGSSSESSLPTSICSESVESLEIPGMFQRSKNYDSNLSRAESINSPITSPALSSQGMATLLQRRLRNRAVDNSDESSPVSLHLTDLKPNNRKLEQDMRERFGSSTDDEDQQERRHVFEAAVIPAAAWLRLGEQRGSESSLSLKGRQGWSETEPENDDDGDGRSLLLNDSQAEEEQDRFSVLDGY